MVISLLKLVLFPLPDKEVRRQDGRDIRRQETRFTAS